MTRGPGLSGPDALSSCGASSRRPFAMEQFNDLLGSAYYTASPGVRRWEWPVAEKFRWRMDAIKATHAFRPRDPGPVWPPRGRLGPKVKYLD